MDRRRFLGFLAIVPFASNAAISGVSSQVVAGDKEASTLIVGLGSCGQNLVKEMIVECRASPDLWPRPIQFHVADEPSVLPENIPSHPLISNDSRHRHDSERTIALPGSLIEQATSADKLIMVAGLGGFIGSYAIVAIAQALSGLKTDIHACVTMPFRFEGGRPKVAHRHLARIQKNIHGAHVFSMDETLRRLPAGSTMLEAFSCTNEQVVSKIRRIAGNPIELRGWEI